MKNKSNKFNLLISRMMVVVMTCVLVPSTGIVKVQALESSDNYEIYPIPQSVEYDGNDVELTDEANVIFDEGVDETTKNRLYEVLSIKKITYTVGTEIKDGVTNFLVGINNSNGVVDNYFKENNLSDEVHFENFDSHIVSAKNNVVAILGRDTDSAFYGLTTLKLIFNQLNDSTMKALLIKDFSDGQWRGFIEGYYGIPWSNENRKSLMEFGGDFKMNAYIFAPKDDEYHSLKWREPYPDEKLAEIQKLAEVGAKTKNKFIWTIHPFLKDGMDFSTDEAYAAELEKIITKFEQLYSIGVRQFGVLADDAEGEAVHQVKLMNDLEAWRVSKGDVYNLIFVPKVYTKESAGGDVNNEYLKTIGTMPDTVDIMWTGDVVLGYVTEDTFDFFEKAVGREAFMWLNWPVNDINNKRLLMGKGEMLDSKVTNFKGIVTNPMQEAQASKVSLFAIADYGWNRAAFDVDKSWADSFRYVDKDAANEMHTFAKHMSDPTPNWHGLALEESEELAPFIQEFTRKLWAKESIASYSEIVLDKYQEIVDDTNSFAIKSKNELLKTEIKPWVDSLRDISESTMAYIKAAVAFEEGNYEEAMRYYSIGEEEYTSSRSYRAPVLGGVTRTEPGIKYLIPFAKDLSRMIGDNFDEVINGKDKLTLRPYTNMGPGLYWGHVQNIVDGDNSRLSCIWMRRGANEDDYVAVELSELTNVNTIVFEHGEPGAGDAFNFVKFQYSLDGEKWIDINNEEYGPQTQKIVIENLDVKAKYLRAVPTGELKGNWVSVREFSVNNSNYAIAREGFEVSENVENKADISKLSDGRLNTFFKPVSQSNEGSLSYKVQNDRVVDKFTIVQNPNEISNATVVANTSNGVVEIGTLDKNINEFDLTLLKDVTEIKIEWNGVAPKIHEIGITEKEAQIIVSKPSNLTSKEVTNSSVTLSWDAPEHRVGLREYVIYKDGKEFTRVPAQINETHIAELKANKLYGFKVSASYSNGKESKPISINVRTKK